MHPLDGIRTTIRNGIRSPFNIITKSNVKLPYLGAPPRKSCFGFSSRKTCNACFFPMTDPWNWHIYLHERLIFYGTCGQMAIHGSYGYSHLPVQRSPKKNKKLRSRSAPAIPAAKQSLKLRRRVAVLDLKGSGVFVEQNSGELPSGKQT